MNTKSENPIVLFPTPLLVEFDPRIRLGEILHKLGPEFSAQATTTGRVRIVPTTKKETADA